MTFVLIRIAIAVVLFVAAALIMKIKFNQKDIKIYLVAFLGCTIIGCALFFVPIEDSFLTFNNREEAVAYVTDNSVTHVLQGKVSDCVITKNSNNTSMLMLPKTQNGYKVALESYVVRAEQYADDDIYINVFRFKNSNDYYMVITDFNSGYGEISDSCNSTFEYEEITDEKLGTYCSYYCYIDGFDKNYSLTLNKKSHSPFAE